MIPVGGGTLTGRWLLAGRRCRLLWRRRSLTAAAASVGTTTATSLTFPSAGLNIPSPSSVIVRSAATRSHGFSTTTATAGSQLPKLLPPIRILYGSQGGTAHMFGMQLLDALQQTQPRDRDISLQGLHEVKTLPKQEQDDEDLICIILISVAGVGEPPDNAREFYEWLLKQPNSSDTTTSKTIFDKLHYTVFGLGNQKAHPNHYNVIGKTVDEKLHELGARRMFALGLGDDGECIEDDFDVWMEELVGHLSRTNKDERQQQQEQQGPLEEEEEPISKAATADTPHTTDVVATETVPQADHTTAVDPAEALQGRRRSVVDHDNYPELKLLPAESDSVREDLFGLASFYADDVQPMTIVENTLLSVKSGDYGLRELTMSFQDDRTTTTTTYEAGDHVVIYPRNSSCMVESFAQQLLDVDPHAIIQDVIASSPTTATSSSTRKYPFPTGITVMETLTHCVDLGAPPSPALARRLVNQHANDDNDNNNRLNYKQDVALCRRTTLDLAIQHNAQLSLEEWLCQLPPMQPRYYSIASSPLRHPHDVVLTYRPVKYVSSRGALREGVCTNFMTHLGRGSRLPAAVRSNPTFRLPKDPSRPVIMMAGGCGIAPIRAFLEERLCLYDTGEQQQFGESHLFLGFRSPSDEVYRELVEESLRKGVLTEAHVSYTGGCVEPDQDCRLVSERLRAHGSLVYDLLLERGGYAYVCGGARLFGAAIERQVLEILQEEGGKSLEEATKQLQRLIKEGRFCEDLAD